MGSGWPATGACGCKEGGDTVVVCTGEKIGGGVMASDELCGELEEGTAVKCC